MTIRALKSWIRKGPGTKVTGHSGYFVNNSYAQQQLASIIVGKAH